MVIASVKFHTISINASIVAGSSGAVPFTVLSSVMIYAIAICIVTL
jgi:hypothetical protein